MKQTPKWQSIMGWLSFLIAIAFFCLQMGYFLIHGRYQVEYIDDRLFYIINMIIIIFLVAAILLLLQTKRLFRYMAIGIAVVFIVIQGMLLVEKGKQVKQVISVSPNFKQVFSVKTDVEQDESIYYRSYYGILARAKEVLSKPIVSVHDITWLENDIAVLTYESNHQELEQFIGTYGDRGGGYSYYQVGAEIHGAWEGEQASVHSGPEGIQVTSNGHTELFAWETVQQFGTLAIVLKRDEEAVWTIALAKDFIADSNAPIMPSYRILLYPAGLENQKPILLKPAL